MLAEDIYLRARNRAVVYRNRGGDMAKRKLSAVLAATGAQAPGHCLSPVGADVAVNPARGLRPVTTDRIRPSTCAFDVAADAQLRRQWQEPPGVPRLSQGDQRQPFPINESMDLRRQPTSGLTDAVIRWLESRIRVLPPGTPGHESCLPRVLMRTDDDRVYRL